MDKSGQCATARPDRARKGILQTQFGLVEITVYLIGVIRREWRRTGRLKLEQTMVLSILMTAKLTGTNTIAGRVACRNPDCHTHPRWPQHL
jgi:hypothetical protein